MRSDDVTVPYSTGSQEECINVADLAVAFGS